MQVYDSSNERRQKRSTKKKSKGGSKYGNDRQSKWNRSGKSNRKTRKSKRRSNNNNIVTESPIHEINISDINEDNCDKMLDKVLELANLEMIEINSTNNNSTNDDDEDAINTFSDDDSNEQYDLETDDSCEFDEEYSFDNVRRVALSNRGRRVSIYDMEFDNNDQTNVEVARRLGLMQGLTPEKTRFSDDFQHIKGTDSSSVNNTITLTFSTDDTYNLNFVFDEKPNRGSTAATDKEISISAAMAGNDATAIANAINTAIANNASETGGGSSLAGIASATASGNVVTLTVTDGKSVDIQRSGDTLSTGNGTVAIVPVTIGTATKTLDDANVSPGYDLTISGDTVLAAVQTGGTNPTITASHL